MVAYRVPADTKQRVATSNAINSLVSGKKSYASRTTKDRDFFAFKKGKHAAEIQRLYLYRSRDKRDAVKESLRAFFGSRVSAKAWEN
jgi:hypothetical protein